MKKIRCLLVMAAIISSSSAFAANTQNEAINIAKRQCRHEMPPKGIAVHWGAIPSGQKMWSRWDGYGPGWEVHGRYGPPNSGRNDTSVIDMIVFVPIHGRASECESIST